MQYLNAENILVKIAGLIKAGQIKKKGFGCQSPKDKLKPGGTS
jgi:hypothetical protein